MIISAILSLFYNLCDSVFNFHIPSFEALNSVIEFIDSIIVYGIDIYQYFIPPAGQVMLTLIIIVEFSVDTYFLMMLIVKKVPVAGID